MTQKTLILGNGPCARHIAEGLVTKGIDIILAAAEQMPDLSFPSSAEVLEKTKVLACRGIVGNFNISLNKDGEKFTRTAANVIIAEEDIKEPHFPLYGLKPSETVLSLSQLNVLVAKLRLGNEGESKSGNKENAQFEKGKKAAFLTGLIKESNSVIAETVMKTCFSLQSDFDLQTYILTKNLKVGGNGLEALYQKCKKAGVIFIKFTDTLPKIHQEENSSVCLEFLDEITHQTFKFMPDMTVADETVSPSPYLAHLAKVFRLHTDNAGFIQSDNVHRLPIFTNRKGIMAAGPSRCVQSQADYIADAENAVTAVLGLASSIPEIQDTLIPKLEDKAEITGGCIRCLTCYRVCPYRAIALDNKPVIMAQACEGCGICTAECPRGIIRIEKLTRSNMSSFLSPLADYPSPRIAVFCCTRSASQAKSLASYMGHDLPRGMMIIEVPCAGSISVDHIFTAFKHKADGVLLLTCHEGNCHSEYGNIYAMRRFEYIREILPHMGIENKRLGIKTLASNMAAEFAKIVNGFENLIF